MPSPLLPESNLGYVLFLTVYFFIGTTQHCLFAPLFFLFFSDCLLTRYNQQFCFQEILHYALFAQYKIGINTLNGYISCSYSVKFCYKVFNLHETI